MAHIAKATLTCRKAGEKQQDYLKIHFEDLLISSADGRFTGQESRSSPSFNFAKSNGMPSCKGELGNPIITVGIEQMVKWKRVSAFCSRPFLDLAREQGGAGPCVWIAQAGWFSAQRRVPAAPVGVAQKNFTVEGGSRFIRQFNEYARLIAAHQGWPAGRWRGCG
jgi:hypothetical protein